MLTRIQLFLAVLWFFVMREVRQIVRPMSVTLLAPVIVLAMLTAPVALPSCSLFTNACDIAIPLIERGEAMLPEANTAIVQASAMVDTMPDGTAKTKALAALQDASMGLRIAQQLLDDARAQCNTPDLAAIFRTFAAAWDALKPFVGNTGGAGGYVPDPKAYTVGMSK